MAGESSPTEFLRPGVRVTLSHGLAGEFVGWKNSDTLIVTLDGDPDPATFHKSWLEAISG
jgi:hypothetical protein